MKRILFITGLVIVLFTACTKELSNDFNAYTNHPLNDTVWVKTVANTASIHDLPRLFAGALLTDSVDISKDTTLTYGDSLEITLPAGAFVTTPGGNSKARLEIFRLKKKGDFIRAFKPTVSGDSILTSQGTFFVRVTKDGNELALAPGASIRLRFADPDMQAVQSTTNAFPFFGREGSPIPANGIDTAFTWRLFENFLTNGLKPYLKQTNSGTIRGYELTAKTLRWLSVQNLLDSTRSNNTKITVILPLNYTNKNTVVFAVLSERKTVVNLSADFASRSFSRGGFPAKVKLKLISISKIGDDIYLGSKDIVDPGTGAIYSLTPEKKTLSSVLQFLDGL